VLLSWFWWISSSCTVRRSWNPSKTTYEYTTGPGVTPCELFYLQVGLFILVYDFVAVMWVNGATFRVSWPPMTWSHQGPSRRKP
jgi:hypothetical protein